MRHDDWRAASRACSGGTILPFFPILIPYIEFVRRGIFKGGLHYVYKRFVVDFVKGKHQRETDGRNHEKYRQKNRQKSVKEETEAAPSSKVKKLLQCQRTEDFILDIYELWDLETHNVKSKIKSFYVCVIRRVLGRDPVLEDVRRSFRVSCTDNFSIPTVPRCETRSVVCRLSRSSFPLSDFYCWLSGFQFLEAVSRGFRELKDHCRPIRPGCIRCRLALRRRCFPRIFGTTRLSIRFRRRLCRRPVFLPLARLRGLWIFPVESGVLEESGDLFGQKNAVLRDLGRFGGELRLFRPTPF